MEAGCNREQTAMGENPRSKTREGGAEMGFMILPDSRNFVKCAELYKYIGVVMVSCWNRDDIFNGSDWLMSSHPTVSTYSIL